MGCISPKALIATAVLAAVVARAAGYGRVMRIPSMSSLFSTRMVAGHSALRRTTSGLRRGDEAPPVPVFMMMPLDTVNATGNLSAEALACLPGVAEVGAEGIMVDVWWGLCEKAPGKYDFKPYLELFRQCQELGLKVQAVMSFHACGGNIGDSVNIPLPQWVLDLEEGVPDLFYMDRRGDPSREYISLSCDNKRVFPSGGRTNRTAVEVYENFMAAFEKVTHDYITNNSLVEIQVGCGPCGELRYPSYPLSPRPRFPDGWRWPGIGELQCYDEGMLRDMRAVLGREEPPKDVGDYNDAPDDTVFWRRPASSKGVVPGALQTCVGGTDEVETWDSPSGAKFLAWYSGALIQHGRLIMASARKVFGKDMRLAAKVSGIHWLRGHPSQAAEATAGYVGEYLPAVCSMLAETGSVLDFTCFEMRDALQSWFAESRPEGLVQAAARAATEAGIEFAGENALFCWGDEGGIETIEQQCELAIAGGADMAGLTALRLEPWLVEPNSRQRSSLERFIRNMKDLTKRKSSRSVVERLSIWVKRGWDMYKARNY